MLAEVGRPATAAQRQRLKDREKRLLDWGSVSASCQGETTYSRG